MGSLGGIFKRLKILVTEEEKRTSEIEKENKKQKFLDEEEKELIKVARSTFIKLGCLIVGSGVIIVLIACGNTFSCSLIFTSIASGILGSTTSALISALERKANGWESKNGDKYPADGKPDKFSIRMSTFFLYRPIFGILAGLLMFFGMQAKYFGDMDFEDQSKVIFWSLLSGLFVKSLIEKLKNLFDSFVGN